MVATFWQVTIGAAIKKEINFCRREQRNESVGEEVFVVRGVAVSVCSTREAA